MVPTPAARGPLARTRHGELTQLAAEASTLDPERPVVFYCRVGNRSAMATDAFRASGMTAYNLRGGITEWVRRGLAVQPADGHVVAEMRSDVEELEHRREELAQYTDEARREAQRVKDAGPGTKGLKDD